MHAPLAFTKQAEIQAAIREVEKNLAPDVVRIRYDISHDWSGEWAIFFRILLTDDAAKKRLGEVTRAVRAGLERHLDYDSMGVWSYHNFRSESEQAQMREEAWA